MWAGISAGYPDAVRVTFPPHERLQVSHGDRLALFSLGLVVIATFGPYTPVGGTRTEQLAVYGCLVIPLLVSWMRIRLTRSAALFLILWGAYLVVASVQSFEAPGTVAYLPGQLLHGADNLLRPIAVVLLVGLWMVTTVDRERMLRFACGLLVAAMISNTVIAFVQSQVDITQWLAHFWSGQTGDVSLVPVAGNAAQLGRFTGLINQPAEAGTLYGMAILAALYLWHQRPKRLILPLIVLVAGGVLTVSKIFLFGAVPLAIWQLATLPGPRQARLGIVGLASTTLTVAILLGVMPAWTGSSLLAGLVNPTGNYLTFFSGSRYGGDTSLMELVTYVLSISPWTGFGLRGLATAYDSGWVQAIVFAGLVGVFAYTGALVVLVHAWWTRRHFLAPDESRFAGGLVLLAIGASAGFPALTGNRVTTVLWLLLSLTLFVSRDRVGTDRSIGLRP